MTVLTRVSATEMRRRTGFGKALGYSLPEEDEILIRKDLPKDLEHKVIAHEEEHISKGEEGPFWGAVIGGALGLLGAKKSSDAAKSATRAQVDAANEEIAFAKETRDLARQDQEPYRQAGYKALDALQSLVGLGGGAPQRSAALDAGPRIGQTLNRVYRGFGGNAGYGRDSGYGSNSGYGSSRFRRLNPFSSDVENRAMGGNTIEGDYYNINELGPESVYSKGKYTRTPNPRTISGTEGYVQPNIKGRALGGVMGERIMVPPSPPEGWGGPQQVLPPDIHGDYRPLGLDGRIGGYAPPNRPPQSGADTTAVDPQTGYPNENPGGVEGGYQFQTEPGYQFRFSEGMRALDRGAASRGGLLSGGYARKAIRYGQGFASNEFSNVYNRIANIAGLGQTANAYNQQGALAASGQVGNALSNQGAARASGYAANANAWGDAIGSVAKLPWDQWFPGKSDGGSPAY